MTGKRFTISSESNQNIWDNEKKCYYSSIDAKQLCDLLNELTEENQKLKDDKNQHLLVLVCYAPRLIAPTPIGMPYDNIYHRTSRQLEKHLKDNGFLVDSVSRASVGDLSFYHVEFNLPDDEWEYEKTNDLLIRKVLGIRNVGLVDFHKQDGMIHEVILVSVKELNDKYLKDGNLVFDDGVEE